MGFVALRVIGKIATQLHPCVAILDVRLRAEKPVPRAYPKELRSIGDHVRKRRLDLKMTQRQVAEIVGVDKTTVWNWERNRTEPLTRHLPSIALFLGYSPLETSGQSLGERLRDYRRKSGLSQKKLAREIGIDPSTLSRLEKNSPRCFKKVEEIASSFLRKADSREDQ